MTSHEMFRIPEGGQIHIQREPGGPFIPLEDVGIFSPELGIQNAPDAPHSKAHAVGDFTTSATFTVTEMDPKVLEMIWGRHDHGLPYRDPWGTEKATRECLQHLFHDPKSAPTQENPVNLTPDDLDTVAAILNEPTVDDLARARRERREPATRTQGARETQKQRDEWREQVTAWFGMDGTVADEVRHNTDNVGRAAELRRQKWADAFKVTEEQITRASDRASDEDEVNNEVNDDEQHGQDDDYTCTVEGCDCTTAADDDGETDGTDEQDDPTAVPPFHATVKDVMKAMLPLKDRDVIDQAWLDKLARTQATKHREIINVYGTPDGATQHKGTDLDLDYYSGDGVVTVSDEYGDLLGKYERGQWGAVALCAELPGPDGTNTVALELARGTYTVTEPGCYAILNSDGSIYVADNFGDTISPVFSNSEWLDVSVD